MRVLTSIRALARRKVGPRTFDESEVAFAMLADRQPGVVLEVGAHYGDATLLRFARAGWEVHAFEPDPQNRAQLEAAVRGLPNVTVVPKAVSDRAGTLPLYRSPESSGISSLTPFTDGHRPAGEVEVIALRDYLSAGPDRVTFLKLDVEGYEKFVLEGFPWERSTPDLVLLEFEDSKTVPLGYHWHDLAVALMGHGYQILVSEWFPIERYGTQHRWRRLARYPTQLTDPNAWGNLIAVRGDIARLERTAHRVARRARAVDRAMRLVRR